MSRVQALYAVDLDDGRVLWRRPLGEELTIRKEAAAPCER
ncbi:MAG: hypothetical protein U0736_11945 [Gemmataceae bacterium]